MATITVDTFLDDGTARTSGEAWTINGGILTIRTDTRFHVGAPVGREGSLGSTTISSSLGGGVLIDGRNVREVWYNTGSGTVPAIGTTITQGGASGYLLGVWTNLTAAPSNAGTSMPTSGFIKFREVTGAFSAGALTGISANATGADTTSWIEVTQMQSATNTVPRLGSFKTRGAWYYLPQTTSGAAGQLIQLPLNSAGNYTHVPAIQIETSAGSGVYEWYPAVSATYFLNANLGTDARSKFVNSIGSARVRIGNDGTTNCGYVPPAGCKIRIANVLLRQVNGIDNSENEAPHATLGNRPDFTVSLSGFVDLEYITADWYLAFTSAYQVSIKNSASFDSLSFIQNASPFVVDNYCSGIYTGTFNTLVVSSCLTGGTVRNSKFYKGLGTGAHCINVTNGANDILFEDNYSGMVSLTRAIGIYGMDLIANRATVTRHHNLNCEMKFTGNVVRVTDVDYCDKLKGSTDATTGLYAFRVNACNDVIVDGITLGMNNTISGFHNPYTALVIVSSCTNATIRNAGTRAAPLLAASSGLSPSMLVQDLGLNDNVRFQRMYMNYTRASLTAVSNTSKNVTFENVWTSNFSAVVSSFNTILKGVGMGTVTLSGTGSVYGSNYHDTFLTDTTGAIWFTMNEPTSFNSSNVAVTLLGATGGFNASGAVVLPTAGDYVVSEMSYFAIGHTAFAKVSPKSINVNHSRFKYEYDIDTGSGFSGSYKTLFKPKLRTAGGTSGSNTITVDALGSDAPAIGDFILCEFGTQIPANTTVTNVVGNVVTVSANFTGGGVGSDNIYFVKALYDEVLDPSVGAKLRIKITAMATNTGNSITSLSLPTTSTLAAQSDNLYILDPVIPITVDATVLADTRVQLYNVTTNTILDNVFMTGTDYSYVLSASVDDVIRIRATKKGYEPFESFAVFTGGSVGFVVNQVVDAIYDSYGIDGAAVTKFVADYVDMEVDLIVASNFTGAEAYCWYSYILTLEDGINLFYGAVTAIDEGNLRINTDTVDLLFDTTTSVNVFQNDNIRIFRSDGGYPVRAVTTGGGGIDIVWRNQVHVIEGSGGGGGGSTAADIWSYATRTLTSAAAPTTAAIRAELATELARIDVATSTRLATAGYTAPSNADITAIKAKTDTLVNAPTLATIEASTVLAKQSGFAGLATSSSVTAAQAAIISEIDAIPTITTADIRAELSTELARIDVAASTRLAAVDYTPLAAGDVWSETLETGFSAGRTLRIAAAAVAGKTTGGPGGFVARNLSDTDDMITGTATQDGNREAAVYGA